MDDTSPAASIRAILRAALHGVRRLATYIPNKWEQNGRRTAAAARSIADKNAKPRWSVRTFFNHFPKRTFDFVERSPPGRAPRVDDDVPLRPKLLPVQPEGFAHAPFDAISHHSFADRTRQRKSQPYSGCRRARQTKRGEQRTRNPDAVVIDLSKVRGSQSFGPARVTRGQTGRLSRRLRSTCGDPARGGALTPLARSWFSSAPGIRGSWRAFDYSAGMCV